MTPGRHIVELCRKNNIRRTITHGNGRAMVNQRRIRTQPIKDEMSYFVALHEIGHVMVGLQDYRLAREAEAWKWAIDNALFPPHPSTKQRIASLMVRYVYRAKFHQWQLPPRGHYFWELMHWWKGDPPTSPLK